MVPDFKAFTGTRALKKERGKGIKMEKENMKFVVSNGEVGYYVICDDNEDATYGIYIELVVDPKDCECVRRVFFTEQEAVMRCRWLCDNQVYPVALYDTLQNIV